MSTKLIVLEKLSEPQRCHGHCDQSASLRILKEGDTLLAATTCPKGYVSRVMAYGMADNVAALTSLIRGAMGQGGDMREEDVRTATRYAWDLAMEGEAEGPVLRTAYWTQNYRRTKSDAPDRSAIFVCARCNALFLQPVASDRDLCSSCSAK